MKKLSVIWVCVLAVLVLSPQVANGMEVQVVGYVIHTFEPGDTLFTNAFDNLEDNILSDVFPDTEDYPEGTTISLWDPVMGYYTSTAVFEGGTWTQDLDLPTGAGAKLTNPDSQSFEHVIAGEVVDFDGSPLDDPPDLPPPHSGPDGLYLWGSKHAVALGPGEEHPTVFSYVVGREPNEGEQFGWWDPATQTGHITTFSSGTWDNGHPTLAAGEAAFFNIGPGEAEMPFGQAAVPEPAGLGLIGLAMLAARKRRR